MYFWLISKVLHIINSAIHLKNIKHIIFPLISEVIARPF